jgi:integrase
MSKPKKRAYGTGTIRDRGNGLWQLKYRPEWADKPLYKYVQIEGLNPRKQATDALDRWRNELDEQKKKPVALSVESLHDLLMADYRRESRETLADTSRKWKKHLGKYFKDRDLSELDSTEVKKYIDFKLEEGKVGHATINRHVSWLHRALKLAREDKLTKADFTIKKMDERAGIRTGFISHEEYLAIRQWLPDHLKMLWCFAYHWGIRKGELLKLQWDWALPYLSYSEPIIKIPGFDPKTKNRITKNGEAHTLPLYAEEMRQYLQMALESRDPKCPYIFQYRGKRLKQARTGFEKARHNAGLDHILMHDTRRTAVRNMVRAGISKKRAMQISGHLTDNVFDRYDIEAEEDAVDTGVKMRRFMEKEAAAAKQLGAQLGAYEKEGGKGISRKLLN